MFKHKNNQPEDEVVPAEAEIIKKKDTAKQSAPAEEKPKPSSKPVSESDLRELMEKNLKWSQIIYEQNRKINRKLAVAAVAGWLRLLIIVAPIVLALWYLPTLIDKFQTTVAGFTGGAVTATGKPSYSLEQLMQLLPLGEAEKAQLKTLLK